MNPTHFFNMIVLISGTYTSYLADYMRKLDEYVSSLLLAD
jgi:hypothetical protein